MKIMNKLLFLILCTPTLLWAAGASDDELTAPLILLIVFVSIIVVVFLIWLFWLITDQYKQRFERNFIFNGASVVILIGGSIIYVGLGWMSSANPDLAEVISFGPDVVMESVWFYIGAFIISLAWITNIRASSFLWGMTQNIIQTIFVAIFSVVIVIGAVLAGTAISKLRDE